MNQKLISRFALLLALWICVQEQTVAQTTPQPTRVAGTNKIERSPDGLSFSFYFNNIPLYRYNMGSDGGNRGNFIGLTASKDGKNYFVPAMCGGVLAADGERIIYPCEPGVSFKLDDQFMNHDSIALHWRMTLNDREAHRYWMSFQIKGKTLVIDISGDDGNGAGITLGEGYSARDDLVVVPVPYLPITSLLHEKTSGSFTSMYFDWERTSCSRMLPDATKTKPVLFTAPTEYFPRTDGIRNKIKERIYLTTSGDIDDVMPNVVGPVAPLKHKLQDKIIVSYHPPFPKLLEPLIPHTSLPSYLDSLKNLGIKNVALIVKDWWWSGYDKGNPRVVPANDFNMEYKHLGNTGNQILLKVRNKLQSLGYTLALHQNYIDMYSGSKAGGLPDIPVNHLLISKLPGTGSQPAWAYVGDNSDENAWAIKPSRVFDVAKQVSAAIYKAYRTDWNYLDVTSALNPSGPVAIPRHGTVNSYVDFDASPGNAGRDSAGMFLYTLHKYRTAAKAVREGTRNGPVQGEGGCHLLYAGYFDDFEARIKTAVPAVSGYSAPLFVDFHLRKLRSKSSFHGAGHIYEFYGRGWDTFFTEKEVMTFIATEIAYGHGGLVTKSAHNCLNDSPCDHSLVQIPLEYKHVLPMQRLLAKATVRNISYFDRKGVAKTASKYIADHPDEFDDITSPNFMGRVRVEYSNGVVVYVNRNREAGSWTISGLPSSKKYNYNAQLGGNMIQGVGAKPSEPVVLPAECGWVWYSTL